MIDVRQKRYVPISDSDSDGVFLASSINRVINVTQYRSVPEKRDWAGIVALCVLLSWEMHVTEPKKDISAIEKLRSRSG